MTKSKSNSSSWRQASLPLISLAAVSFRSKPAEKARPVPWTTTAATAGSATKAASAAVVSRIRALFKAFSASGRLKVMIPTRPSVLVMIGVCAMVSARPSLFPAWRRG